MAIYAENLPSPHMRMEVHLTDCIVFWGGRQNGESWDEYKMSMVTDPLVIFSATHRVMDSSGGQEEVIISSFSHGQETKT